MIPKKLSQTEKDILCILYADNQSPVKETHLPWMLKYLRYLRGERRQR